MAGELRVNLNVTASNLAPFDKIIGVSKSGDLTNARKSAGAMTATTTPTSIPVSTSMTSTRGYLSIVNNGSVAVKVYVLSGGSAREFGEAEVGGLPCWFKTAASADIQVASASGTADILFEWLSR